MADPDVSQSSPEEDQDFDPTAEMLVHDYDDEQTLDEEEAMSNDDSVGNELDDLQKESEIPVEELLAMYGYSKDSSSSRKCEVPSSSLSATDGSDVSSYQPQSVVTDSLISSEKSCTADSVGSHEKFSGNLENGEVNEESSGGLVEGQFNTADFLSSELIDGGSDDDEDYDPEQDQEDWKKSVSVGPEYQAHVPESPSGIDGNASDLDKEDRILWNPNNLAEDDVAAYLADVHKHNQSKSQGFNNSIPTGSITRDDEQALYLLLQCDNNFEEALRRHKLQAIPPTDPMSLWTEEECRNFENGLRLYGKDFFLNQQNKVKSRSVREIVQFYYLWKKTERHDAFAARTRLEKKKYALHPGITDYMDRFIYEFESPLTEASANACTSSSSLPNRGFQNLNNDFRSPDSLACQLPSCSVTSLNYQPSAVISSDQCCEGLLDCCNASSGVSCSYEELTSGANSFPQPQLVSNCQLITNSDASLSPSFSACYDYPPIASSSIYLPPQCGSSSYTLHHSHHVQSDVHNPCCASQVDSTFLPVATQVFGTTICNASSALSFPPTSGFYPVVDSLVSDPGFACTSKSSNDCSLGMVDVEGLLASSNMNVAIEPQELTINDINMIFGNVDRSTTCGISGPVTLHRNDVIRTAGDIGRPNVLSAESTTPGFLPASMQKLCSDDGIEPTLDSISATIQELVDPEVGLSPENILSVLEGGSCCNMASTSSVPNNSVEISECNAALGNISETAASNGIFSLVVSNSESSPGFFQFGSAADRDSGNISTVSKIEVSYNISSQSTNFLEASSHRLPSVVNSSSLLDKAGTSPITEFESKECKDTSVTS